MKIHAAIRKDIEDNMEYVDMDSLTSMGASVAQQKADLFDCLHPRYAADNPVQRIEAFDLAPLTKEA